MIPGLFFCSVERLAKAYPDEKEGAHGTWAGALRRFAYEFATGDTVITYGRDLRRYLVGTLTSGYAARRSAPSSAAASPATSAST